MTDYVIKQPRYQRSQYTGDPAAFLADMQGQTGWWNFAVYASPDNTAVIVRAQSNTQAPRFFELTTNQYLVYRNGPDEYPFIDSDGSMVDAV